VKRALGYKPLPLDPDPDALMNPFWSQIARELSPYVPGEQPRIANLVKLNTNASPFGASPLPTRRPASRCRARKSPDCSKIIPISRW
jgi:hypothetical protein